MNKSVLTENVLLPDGQEIPMWAYAAALLSAPVLLVIIALFMLDTALWPGLFMIVAAVSGIIWLGSRGNGWMAAQEPVDNDWFFEKFPPS